MIYTAYQRFFFLPPFEDLPPLVLIEGTLTALTTLTIRLALGSKVLIATAAAFPSCHRHYP